MIKKIMVLSLVIAGIALAGVGNEAISDKHHTLYHSENIQAIPVEMPRYTTQELEGEIAGFSTYDHQNHVTLHRFAVDADGYAHMFWMKSVLESPTFDDRNTSYNVYDHGAEDFIWDGGVQSDGATRSGYGGGDVLSTSQAVSWFHEQDAGDPAVLWTGVTVDAAARFGTFSAPVRPGNQGAPGPEIYWPQGYVDRVNDYVLITARTPDDNEEPITRIFYARSTDGGATYEPFNVLVADNTATGPHIVGSADGAKIAMIYTKGYPCQGGYTTSYASDVYYIESTDGGATWSSEYNVTEDHTLDNPPVGTEVDPYPTPLSTNFAGTYDSDGNLHIVWRDVRTWLNETDPLSIWINHPFHARIMHWSEETNDITRISGFRGMYVPVTEEGDTLFDVWEEGWWGFDQEIQQNHAFYNCARPVAVFDGGVGLCFWRGQRYYDDISQANTINWDLFVAITDDGGATWNPIMDYPDSLEGYWPSEITNLTDTYTPGGGIGACKSEDYPDLDERDGITVAGGEYSCPLFYQQDLFSGSAIHETATQNYFTMNPQMYLPADAWGAYVGQAIGDTDTNVVLEEEIVGFELVSPSVVGNAATWRISSPVAEASLKVYDATGSLVADISAGNATTMTWDTRETASGVYYYIFNYSYYTDKGRVIVVH